MQQWLSAGWNYIQTRLPFTVPESERSTVCSHLAMPKKQVNFVDANQGVIQGSIQKQQHFLIPNKGGFSWDAYKTMTDMGLRKNLRVDEHLRKIQTAADLQTYYDKKNEYESKPRKAVATDYERSRLA
jgi:hypothetical protein